MHKLVILIIDIFPGLASPPAATLLASSVWLANDSGYVSTDLPALMVYSMMFLTISIGLLMVINVPYYSFKNINYLAGFFGCTTYFHFLLVLIASNPPKGFIYFGFNICIVRTFLFSYKKNKRLIFI